MTQFTTANPTHYAVVEIKKLNEKFHKAFGELCDALDVLVTLDPTYYKEHEMVMQASQDKFEAMIERTIATIRDIRTPATQQAAAAAAPPVPAEGN